VTSGMEINVVILLGKTTVFLSFVNLSIG